jgi:hypothetical protein
MEQAIENVKNFSLKTYLMERTPLGLRERLKEREKNGLLSLYSIVAGIDILKDSIVCCVLSYGHRDGYEIRTFGTFKKDIKEMVDWLVELKSSKSPWKAPESRGLTVTHGRNIHKTKRNIMSILQFLF